MNKKTTAFLAAATAALAAGAFVYNRDQPKPEAPQALAPSPAEVESPIPPEVKRPVPPTRAYKSVVVYRVTVGGERSRLDPVTIALPPDQEPMAAALNQMAGLKDSPLPPGTRARSVTLNGDGVAFADFNQAFHKNFPGGNEEEALTINAVLATLAQFFGVERVQITVENKKIDSLGGHQELTDPLPVREAAETAQTAQDTAR